MDVQHYSVFYWFHSHLFTLHNYQQRQVGNTYELSCLGDIWSKLAIVTIFSASKLLRSAVLHTTHTEESIRMIVQILQQQLNIIVTWSSIFHIIQASTVQNVEKIIFWLFGINQLNITKSYLVEICIVHCSFDHNWLMNITKFSDVLKFCVLYKHLITAHNIIA